MTIESLSPASRIVIETSSRPPGERSRSISLTGGAAAAAVGVTALALALALAPGAASGAAIPAVEPGAANEGPAARDAKSCAPNGLVCEADGGVNPLASRGRLSGALPPPLNSGGATAAAEFASRVAGAGVEASAFRALRAASCAAARPWLGRFAAAAPARFATGAAAAPVDGTAPTLAGMASPCARSAAAALAALRPASAAKPAAPALK